MDEGKAREKQARAEQAEALLRNNLFNEAFEYLDAQFLDAWRQSGVADVENRERIYQLTQSLATLKGYFQSVVEDGKLAQVQLDDFKRRVSINKR
jgi:hypothetical protein